MLYLLTVICSRKIILMHSTLRFFFNVALFLSPIVLIESCRNSSTTNENSTYQKISADQTKFIQIDDAKVFLPTWSKDNVLIVNEVSEPGDLHPTNSHTALCSEIMGYTQIYLLGTDFHTLTLRPIAVKSLPTVSENGLEYTYELRNDITFDDGKKLSVEDVIFTFKANKCPLTNNPQAKPYLDNLLDIQINEKNPSVFKLIMKEKYIQNMSFLNDYPILQRAFFDKNNVLSKYTFAQFTDKKFKTDSERELNEWANDFNSAKYGRDVNYLVGAGPYKIDKWDVGQSITLIRKKDHWTKGSSNMYESSYPEKIIFKINRDPNSQLLELKSQSIDVSIFFSTAVLLELQADPNFNANYNSRFTDTYNYGYIALNTKSDGIKHKKLFTDKKVRRAMAMLAPLDDINKIINKGKNKRVVGPVSPLKPDYNTDLRLIPFDIAGAKKLLDEAGWKDTDGDNIRDKIVDGVKIKMEFTINYLNIQGEWKNMVQMITEQMYKAGVKANLNPLDASVLMEAAKNHDFDMMVSGWGGTFVPEDFTQLWHTSSWVSGGSNFSGFGNAKSDALIDSIKYTLDDTKRIAMVKRFQEMVYDEQPYIFLFAGLRRSIIHKRFGNQEMYFERPGVWLSNLKLLLNSTLSK